MFIWLHCIACGVFVPQSGIKPVPLAVEVWSLNHWTTIRRRFLYPEKVYLTGKISPVQVNVWLDKLTQNNKIFHSRKIYQLSMRARAAYPSSCSKSVLTKQLSWTSLVAQTVKRLPTMRETRVQFLDREDPLEKEMAIHSRTLAWKIPWMEEPDRLQSMGLQRVGHD